MINKKQKKLITKNKNETERNGTKKKASFNFIVIHAYYSLQ